MQQLFNRGLQPLIVLGQLPCVIRRRNRSLQRGLDHGTQRVEVRTGWQLPPRILERACSVRVVFDEQARLVLDAYGDVAQQLHGAAQHTRRPFVLHDRRHLALERIGDAVDELA